MEISDLQLMFQIAGYFKRAENGNHPQLIASIMGSLFKRFYPNYNGIRYIDGKYIINFNNTEFLEFGNFESLLRYAQEYIEDNIDKIKKLAKDDPMLFIR